MPYKSYKLIIAGDFGFVFQGENDEFGSINQVHAFDTALGKVTKWIVKHATHTAHKEKKEEVFAAIVNFIKN